MADASPELSALSSRIAAVTVYRSGAMVERVAKLPAGDADGTRMVKLVGLPLCLTDGSVRIEVRGAARLPVARDFRVVLELGTQQPGLAPAENEALRAKKLQVQLSQDRCGQLEAQRRQIADLEIFARPAGEEGQPPPVSPTAARLKMVEFQAQQLDALDKQLAQLRPELRVLREELAELEAREREASAARQPKAHELRKTVVVTLDTGRHDDAELVVTYMVPGARWLPAYTINLSADMRSGELAMRAAVVQRTGEDWRGVALTLTTADAHRWTELPEMQSLRIGRAQPPVQARGWRPPPVGAGELYRDYDRFMKSLPKPTKVKAKPRPKARPARRPPPPPAAPPAVLDALADETTAFFPDPQSMTKTGAVFGGAPPPMQSMPMPMAPPAPARGAARKRSKGIVVAKQARASTTGAFAMAPGSGGGGGGGLPEGAPEPAIRDDMLAYGDLRMRKPNEARRGNLVLLQRRERYREWLLMREVEVSFDVVAMIDTATREAAAVASVKPPPHHVWVSEDHGFSSAYHADTPVEIESDGQYHSVALTKSTVETRLHHVVVPRESTDVFRNVELKNPTATTLFRGPVDVSVGGNYLLTSELRTCPSGGKVQLGLGVEQAIKVSRNTRYSEETAGLMGGTLKLHHSIEIELANRLAQAADIEVRERLPTAREGDEEVTVEEVAVNPPWRRYEPETYKLKGGHRWQLRLEPGKKQLLQASYDVRLSSKRELVGGNRRE